MSSTIVALYLWTTVAATPRGGHNPFAIQDWRYQGEFASVQHCEEGARQLGLKKETFRCVDTGRKQ